MVNFRKLEYSDIEETIKLCNECFDENTDYEHAEKVFKETENDKNQIYIIGEIDGKIISHAKITIVPTIYKEMGTYAILNHVCVKEEYRRHNIATLMLKVIKEICKKENCNSIKLWSRNFRIPAHICYKRFGFEPNDATFFTKDMEVK